jgi:hypothetical protein
MQTGELLYSRKSPEGDQLWAISPDGNILASCTVLRDPQTYEAFPGDRIFLLDLGTTSPGISRVLEAPQGGICSPMVFSPDSQFLAAQSGYIWKLAEAQPQASFAAQPGAPLLFIADGALLVSGNRLIQADSGEVLAELEVNGEVNRVGIDAEGYHLVLATKQGVEVWKVSSD